MVAMLACSPLVSQATRVHDVNQVAAMALRDGLHLDAAASKSTRAYSNIWKPKMTFRNEPNHLIVLTGFGYQYKKILKVMSAIDRMIQNGDHVPWAAFPAAPPLHIGGRPKKMTYKQWFQLFKV